MKRIEALSLRPLVALFTVLCLPMACKAAPSYLERYCMDCHDPETRKGGLDLSSLNNPSEIGSNFESWLKVYERIEAGEMPPKKKSRPPEAETLVLLSDLARHLEVEDLRRRSQEGRAAFRRLTRTEYQNTLRDLLELPYLEVRDMLPPDGQRAGFDKVGEALDLSEIQLTQYLNAADKALSQATCSQLLPPSPKKERIYPNWIKFGQALRGGDGLLINEFKRDTRFALVKPAVKSPPTDRFKDNGITWADFTKSNTQAVGLIRASDPSKYRSFLFSAPADGEYRLRVSSWSFCLKEQQIYPNDRTEVAALWSGNRLLGYVDAPSFAPASHEMIQWLSKGDGIRFETETVRHAAQDIAEYTGPGIAVDWLEVEGPVNPQWPPASHRLLFGDLPLRQLQESVEEASPVHPKSNASGKPKNAAKQPHCSVFSEDPLGDSSKLLSRFLTRAFRRPIAPAELARYTAQVQESIARGDSFERAMKSAYRTALCSIHFLFRSEEPGPLQGPALANRLSFWLWSSSPDATLSQLGASGEILKPKILSAQVERLLKDPRAERFATDFLNQWLNLQKIGDTTPDKDLYPEFTPYLQDCMVAETKAYFREVLEGDLGVEHIVSGTFAMVNGGLADLYKIPGVDGHAIRRVELPHNSGRGGFITQAAVLKVTANGTTTSPVVRGAWFNERILGMPLPPPPPNVGAVEPDTRGATTIREQLDKHRRDASCAACHERIDPPGFALEAFDVIGGHRSRYRSLGEGIPLTARMRDGRNPTYKEGLPVDCAGRLPDGRLFNDVAELRQRLLENRELLAKNFISQMVVFSTGSEIHFADRREMERILGESRAQGFGLRSMIHLIAQSDLFKNK